jgi:hypothetical protein
VYHLGGRKSEATIARIPFRQALMEDLFDGWLSMPTVTSFLNLEEDIPHGESQIQENPREEPASDGGHSEQSYESIVGQSTES